MKQVILYGRVSTQQQALHGYSIEAQIKKMKQYAELKEYKNIILLTDSGYSGKNMNRPGFIRMIEMVKQNEVEAIIIYSISRFARNIIDTLKTIELLNRYNIAFHSITENIDTSTAMGRFFITTIANIAQLEREQISERTKLILQHKKENNERTGQLAFGYSATKKNKLVINKSEMNTLKLIKELKENGFTYSSIADILIKRNRKNKNGNIYWNKGMICRLYFKYCKN